MRVRGDWVVACAAAETVGMTASAGAARLADAVSPPWPAALALGVIVLGGLVEGAALGWGQSSVLVRRLPDLSRRRYFWATLLVAGVGWAVASAPAAVSADEASESAPSLWLVLLGAAGIGLVMGPVLGGAQAWALRGAARTPARWVVANTLAWPPVMVVVFLGATTPGADWSLPAVMALGAATGVAAGTVLGVLTAPFLPEESLPSPEEGMDAMGVGVDP